MALTIYENKADEGVVKILVDCRLYLNAERNKLVEEGDPEAKFLFCSAGKYVAKEELIALGVSLKPVVKPLVQSEVKTAPRAAKAKTKPKTTRKKRATKKKG